MKRHFLLPLFLVAAAANLSGSVIYKFAVNTSSISGQSANLDFQLSTDGLAAGITAAITGLATDGSYDPAAVILTGDATGALPDTLVLDNGTGYNDAYQSITLGNFVNFFLTLSGAGINSPATGGSTFAFSIYDNAGITPLLTSAADGSISGVVVDQEDGIAPYTNSPGTASVTSTPEPGTYLLASLGFVAVLARRFRR